MPPAALRRPLLAFLSLYILQIGVAAIVPLVADEAYYLAWSRDLAFGYLDHPPGIAWWVSLGGAHPRLPGLLLMPIAWGLLADAARRWDIAAWPWVPAAALATPLGFSAGLLATPDVPLVFCFCAALWAIAADRPLWVGLAIGLGLWSKSAMLVALPGLWWVLGPRRGTVALVVAAAVYAPHVHWSLTHNGLPWSFQAGHRRPHGNPLHVFEALGGQLLVVTPFVAWAAVRAWRRPADALDRTLRTLGLPVLAVWMGLSLTVRVEANWAALAWPATLLLILRRPTWPRTFRRAAGLTAVAALALPVLDAAFPEHGPPRDGPRLRACLGDAPLVASRYQEKALLDLAGPPVGYLRAEGHRVSEYDRHPVPVNLCGATWLGPPAALGDRCPGVVEPGEACGRIITRCRCGVLPGG